MMEKRLVVIKQGKHAEMEGLAEILKTNGWMLETIEISEGEPLPRSLEHIDGLLIFGNPINVFEQHSNPMHVYLGL